ncbi:MAG: UDP-3-O-(3-hydroxymyristoyl)glucosamine N-acyltransferase [Desulfobacterales bacterium]|nr:UDP-3-O-(3-hydroxymyristoyl)glucosamine N-acyltransferase [Desulfobacteraceae bacterium]MBT4364403.1 UDP-3-O-(3-hydroxymyristoyl)glucosamine N-acyltransferase [Desulfobacteraceae bacterium]MBT7085702.1 UDP-3-O-(3-hydroxymyristoyl)glucosamine N-acyltransferase [Desulfobacterales bacterium]MBT7696237.1 UDP-3-O-(3-hydroxymyristoyl)glucosamine N-acyltransferase [Desulfobacterales bacterium]
MEITLSRIAEILNGELKGDPEKSISGAVPFEVAGNAEITFAGSKNFLKKIDEACAGCILVPHDLPEASGNLIIVKNPHVAFARVVQLFYQPVKQKEGINSAACIADDFKYGTNPSIGPSVVIYKNVTIGDRVTIHPNVTIEDSVIIGDDVTIYPNTAILSGCRIGNRVIINAGTVIGSDGFGFAFDGEVYHKIPHIGVVTIGDDVEIGACNAIDRATFGETKIGKGVKTDNLVHVAHNVSIGDNSVFAGQAGISGSVNIGKNVVLAGQAGVAGHLEIGDNVTVGPKTAVLRSVASGEVVSGIPEMPHKLWLRSQRIIPKLPEMRKKIKELEKRLNELEKK